MKRWPHIRRTERRCHCLELDLIFVHGRRSSDGIKDAVIGMDSIAAQVERPIHGKEDVVVYNVWLVVVPSFFGI